MALAAAGEGLSKGAQTRRAILEAAIVRFGRDGYRGTSVADIARDAAVGGTVTYAYFSNKEELFLAAVDDDAAGVIEEGLARTFAESRAPEWWQTLIESLVGALERHPLARRLLAGLEPDVTARVLDMPALAELRGVCAEQLRREQVAGRTRGDIDPVVIANGLVSIMLSLLMSVVQLGGDTIAVYGHDIGAVFEAAVGTSLPGVAPPRKAVPAATQNRGRRR
jgi:AcrR family transcriptional regulator